MTSMKAENKSIKRITKQSWVYKRLKWQPEKVVVQNGKECENIYRDRSMNLLITKKVKSCQILIKMVAFILK